MKTLRERSDRIENGLEEIFQEKGLVSVPAEHSNIPEKFRSFRRSVGAVIVPEDWQNYRDDILQMPLAMGINGRNGTLEFLGGGLESEQEKEIKMSFEHDPDSVDSRYLDAKGQIPGYLYFLMQGASLLDHGKLFQPTFDVRSGMDAILSKELKRELQEEAGDQAASLVQLDGLLSNDPKITQLMTVGFGGMNGEIQAVLVDQNVRFTEDQKKLMGFLIEVQELGMLATADLDALIQYAEKTEEVRGMMMITVGDLLNQGEIAAKDGVDGWNGWDMGAQGRKPRNPSVFYLLKSFLEYAEKV